MRSRALVVLVALLAAVLTAAGCGGGGGESGAGTSGGSTGGTAKQGGVLRIGTINYIDSFNPFKYIEAQATNAFIMLYPQLVQYSYTQDNGYKIEGDWATSWDTSTD